MNEPEPFIVRILSMNIHKGISMFRGRALLKILKEKIKEARADVLCLQEVIGRELLARSSNKIENHYEFLADNVWSHYSYAKNSATDRMDWGNAVLSKFPIRNTRILDLTIKPFESRGLLECELQIPESNNQSLFVASTHLGLKYRERKWQLQKMEEDFCTEAVIHQKPYVIAGDFNDWTGRQCRVFEESCDLQEVFQVAYGRYAKTYPAAWPLLPLDRIYFSSRCRLREARLLGIGPRQRLSDHVGLLCEIEVLS